MNETHFTEEQVEEIYGKPWFIDPETPGSLFVPRDDDYQGADQVVEDALMEAERNGNTSPEDIIRYVQGAIGTTLEAVPDVLKRYEPETGMFDTA